MSETDHFVVYADMLAFRNLVMRHQTTDSELLHYRRQTTERMVASLAGGNPLQRRFRDFHAKLDDAITHVNWATEVAVVVFSDSMFLATTDADSCMAFCERVVLQCALVDVPVRVGVGYGTFVSNSFAFESTPKIKVITTQFFGTGVVNAVEAEKALKGMRIALHPSAAVALKAHKRVLKLPPTLETHDRTSHEWNYLPPGNDRRRSQGFNRDEFVRQIRKMAAASENDPSIQVHYTETIDAISRMVHQMHNEWLPGKYLP